MESTKSGGVIAYIHSSSPESGVSDASDCSQQPSPPPVHLSLSQRCEVFAKAPLVLTRPSTGSEKMAPNSECGASNIGGLVLLCKVCGDVASGFHYGVHACEGCKGFFRRSIQQNIQYKKCLKNENCPIMRISRNRCQQCRFKKCLSVGMSRDAVRFGRIPKREKQRMFLEMQSAVNSMMRKNPLHRQLHGNHSPPHPMESITNDAKGSPSSSCPASSPQSPQENLLDIKPRTSVNASPSSTSDSGEEEVIGTVTKSHGEDFMYNREQSSLKAEPPLSPSVARQADGQSKEQQENWNRWNDQMTMADFHMSTHQNLQGTNRAYRNYLLNYCPAQQYRSIPSSHWPGYPHRQSNKGHPIIEAGSGAEGFGELAWRRGIRMHLVCPMNTSPFVDPCKSSHEIWEEFSASFTPAVHEVVEFAKRIPGFRDLSQQDQICLLKAGTFEVLVVRFASLFDSRERTVTFLSGGKYSVEALRSMGAGDLLNSMFEFSEKLAALRLSEEEMSLFTAVVLVSADRSGIENVNSVEALQESLIRALRSLIAKNHTNAVAIFTRLLLKLPDLRSLNSLHSEELLAFKVQA